MSSLRKLAFPFEWEIEFPFLRQSSPFPPRPRLLLSRRHNAIFLPLPLFCSVTNTPWLMTILRQLWLYGDYMSTQAQRPSLPPTFLFFSLSHNTSKKCYFATYQNIATLKQAHSFFPLSFCINSRPAPISENISFLKQKCTCWDDEKGESSTCTHLVSDFSRYSAQFRFRNETCWSIIQFYENVQHGWADRRGVLCCWLLNWSVRPRCWRAFSLLLRMTRWILYVEWAAAIFLKIGRNKRICAFTNSYPNIYTNLRVI